MTREATILLMAGLISAFPARLAGAQTHDEQSTADRRDATIVLHVVNLAALPRDILNRARDRVAKVYQGIGVRIVWIESEQPVGKHMDGGLHLSILLLPHDIAERKISGEGLSDALGLAHHASGRAYIFCDRIAAMPRTTVFAIADALVDLCDAVPRAVQDVARNLVRTCRGQYILEIKSRISDVA